jgi:glycosyltransferase involved in cell wall biosynthesis
MDKIGLVTITYNSADVLQPFLDCVWQQTHNNLVLYVVDNASQDSTRSILEKENDSRLRIINN